jgi:hypothetical protein
LAVPAVSDSTATNLDRVAREPLRIRPWTRVKEWGLFPFFHRALAQLDAGGIDIFEEP